MKYFNFFAATTVLTLLLPLNGAEARGAMGVGRGGGGGGGSSGGHGSCPDFSYGCRRYFITGEFCSDASKRPEHGPGLIKGINQATDLSDAMLAGRLDNARWKEPAEWCNNGRRKGEFLYLQYRRKCTEGAPGASNYQNKYGSIGSLKGVDGDQVRCEQ